MNATLPVTDTPAHDTPRRNRLMLGIVALVVIGLLVYGVSWLLHGRYLVETDNAYVAGNIVQLTPQAAGMVVSVAVEDTDSVAAGQMLVELDRADAELALATAEAQLAQALREVKGLFANQAALGAAVAVRSDELARARQDLSRRQSLAGTGAIAEEDIEHARATARTAEAALKAAEEQQHANRVLIERTTPREHPSVTRARLRVQESRLALERTRLLAPVSGYVARRAAQPGQRVAAGTPLMAIVPLDQLWVDANFKESQLGMMRLGQPVELRADFYGGDVSYHGKIAGFAAGTGTAFSLLPAQNAAGNWIKVVQRLPVRITLDAQEIAGHPLRVGLSMRAVVDTHDQSGERLTNTQRSEPASQTQVYARQAQDAGTHADRLLDREDVKDSAR